MGHLVLLAIILVTGVVYQAYGELGVGLIASASTLAYVAWDVSGWGRGRTRAGPKRAAGARLVLADGSSEYYGSAHKALVEHYRSKYNGREVGSDDDYRPAKEVRDKHLWASRLHDEGAMECLDCGGEYEDCGGVHGESDAAVACVSVDAEEAERAARELEAELEAERAKEQNGFGA